MAGAEQDAIIDKHLPLPLGTRIKKKMYGPTGDKEYKGTIVEKKCLCGDFMYLVEYDEAVPGGFGKTSGFGKAGGNIWTIRVTGLNNLFWEYHPLERAENDVPNYM